MKETPEITLDMLKVRNPEGGLVSVGEWPWGDIQADYLKNAGQKNIVWKSRQTGMTTFSLARGFLKAMQGKTCIVVAQNSGVVPFLWSIVERFAKNIPNEILPITHWCGSRYTFGLDGFSRSQFSVVSPSHSGVGCGTRIDFLHFNEFAWWREDNQRRIMNSVLPCLSPDAEVIVESTPPDKDSGMFHEIWDNAGSYGFTRHLFPWWKNPKCVAEAVDPKTLTKDEVHLFLYFGLTFEQIGWRRKVLGRFMETEGTDKHFKAEYGEDAV